MAKARFSKLQEAYLTRRIPGTEYMAGDRVVVISVVNNGTRRNPTYRYYVRGAWLDEDAMSEANTLVDLVLVEE